MKIAFLLPSLFASKTLFPERIFAPLGLAVDIVTGLIKKGHQVTVFSTPDFPADTPIVSTNFDYYKNKLSFHKLRNEDSLARKVRTDEVLKRNFELTVTIQAFTYAQKEKLDIIHSYHDFVFTTHYLENLTHIPTVYTLHDPLPPQGVFEYQEFVKFASHDYVSISDSQRKSTLKLNFIDTVYHGLNINDFTFQDKPSDYLLFMGRLVPEKGLHHAIATALATNKQLEIGTHFPDPTHENEYFISQIKPFLDNPLIGEPGMVMGQDKVLLYKQAQALLFPIGWDEPFGMVLIEAMACGTPVIAFNRGSVPEIVKDGITGFIVNPPEGEGQTDLSSRSDFIIKKSGTDGLVEGIKRIGEIDRCACRKHVEDNFTIDKMVDGYERVYQKVCNL